MHKFILHFVSVLALSLSYPVSSFGQINELYTLGDKLLSEIVEQGYVHYEKATLYKSEINHIGELLGKIEIENLDDQNKKAFLINAYNLTTISKIVGSYPVTSVQKISGFFSSKQTIGGKQMSLDDVEKSVFDIGKDFRIHLALVCGARSCPSLQPYMYKGEHLEEQLEAISLLILNDPKFVDTSLSDKLSLSQLFKWNHDQLGSDQNLVAFINEYHYAPIDQQRDLKYKPYDWKLNDIRISSTDASSGNNDPRYFVSRLYRRGEYELRLFNNYYTQLDQPVDENDFTKRGNFFSVLASTLIGVNDRLNIGVEVKLRSANQNFREGSSIWEALKFGSRNNQYDDDGVISYARRGLTAITPIIKYQPIKGISSISIQHSFYIPIGKDLQGNNEKGFIDWGSPVLLNQIFYDQILSDEFSIFAEIGFSLENINKAFLSGEDGFYQYSIPLTYIFNYYFSRKSTVYAIVNATPRWAVSVANGQHIRQPDSYNQIGMGYKYFITQKLQGELLYTRFNSASRYRNAHTFNIAFRYFGR